MQSASQERPWQSDQPKQDLSSSFPAPANLSNPPPPLLPSLAPIFFHDFSCVPSNSTSFRFYRKDLLFVTVDLPLQSRRRSVEILTFACSFGSASPFFASHIHGLSRPYDCTEAKLHNSTSRLQSRHFQSQSFNQCSSKHFFFF